MHEDIPFTIKSINEGTVLNANGDPEDVYIVKWTIPQLGNYTTNIPKGEFNAQSAQELIQQHANELGHLVLNVSDTHSPQTN